MYKVQWTLTDASVVWLGEVSRVLGVGPGFLVDRMIRQAAGQLPPGISEGFSSQLDAAANIVEWHENEED